MVNIRYIYFSLKEIRSYIFRGFTLHIRRTDFRTKGKDEKEMCRIPEKETKT